MTPFAERIRQSFEQMKSAAGDRQPADLSPGEVSLRGHSWDSIARLPRDTFNSAELDAVYAAVVRSYQRGERSSWAPLLLEMLAPAILQKLDALFSDIPEADADDIEQQLVLEVLRWASRLRTPDDLRFVDGTILQRATERTSRWLRRARRKQPEALPDHPECEYPYRRAELDELSDLCGGEISREDVVLVYRFDVWHEPVGRLAREQGVSEAAISTRIWRARQRLRQHLQPKVRPPDVKALLAHVDAEIGDQVECHQAASALRPGRRDSAARQCHPAQDGLELVRLAAPAPAIGKANGARR